MKAVDFLVFEYFWAKHPALLYSIFMYIGCLEAMNPNWVSFIPLLVIALPCLWLPLHSLLWRRVLIALAIGATFFFYVTSSISYPLPEHESISGSAIIEIEDIVSGIRYGKNYWKYRVKICSLEPANSFLRVQNIPATLIWNSQSPRPEAGFRYEVMGTLKKQEAFRYQFVQAFAKPWKKREKSFSLAEWRLRAKVAFKVFLYQFLPPGEARAFLQGVMIGDFHDPTLQSHMQRSGLQHIMAISGFHFSLLIAFAALFLRVILPSRIITLVLVAIATLYLIFIGSLASVLRAWFSISLVLVAKMVEKSSNGLNNLGLALIGTLLVEPTFCITLSFQLSFIATGAILLFYPLFQKGFEQIFPLRPLSCVLVWGKMEQLGYMILSFLRSSLALVFSVNIIMTVTCLYFFQNFPVLSLFYNCIFPFLTAIAMVVLCLACLLWWVPILSTLLFSGCQYFVEGALRLLEFTPPFQAATVVSRDVSSLFFVVYVTAVVFFGILFRSRINEQEQMSGLLQYV